MRAIVIREPGGPDVLELKDVPMPEPSHGEVRVRVCATAVNRADLLQRQGMYPAPPGSPIDIPGLEFAGEIDALGSGVEALDGIALTEGERVCGLAGGGCYAEYVLVHARTLARLPKNVSFTDGAALPEAFTTAYDAMVSQARLSSGETVLVHAAGSGVGTAAIQIAKAIGARVIGTARTASKLERCRELGMDDGVVVSNGKFADAVVEKTGGRGVDVVLELVGGDYVKEDLACTAEKGRIVLVGMMGGHATEMNLAMLLRKRLTLRGTQLRARPLEEKIAAGRAFARHVVPLISEGKVRAVVDRILPLEKAAEAHELTAGNTTFGKVVLSVS
ncbi:MAG: NAD(P)H-quinone oxidoreductase [Polyangiaceae bacterium]